METYSFERVAAKMIPFQPHFDQLGNYRNPDGKVYSFDQISWERRSTFPTCYQLFFSEY